MLGVIIEINFLDQPETVVAYADGDSRYFGGNGAFLGEKRRRIVQKLAKVIVSAASRFAGSAKRDPDPHALPKQNTFRFTFLTPSGPLVSTRQHVHRRGNGGREERVGRVHHPGGRDGEAEDAGWRGLRTNTGYMA